MIHYQTDLNALASHHLEDFFVGWPHHPSPEGLLQLLQGSSYRVLAREGAEGPVVGFITALSDGVLTAFIPLLEVLPRYQNQGIGSELMRQMLNQLAHLYSIDLVCDPALVPFYENFGLRPHQAMILRHYENQGGL
jgi:ribosomal protein S18 acetylase RimI-like enzyme